jgi:hypothetical protein
MGITLNPLNFIPTTESQASEWILWHKSLKKRYGKASANTIWLKAWGKRGCDGIGCDTNTVELRDYVATQGIQIERGTWDFIPDTIDNIGDFTTQAFNLSLYIALAVVAIILLFFGLLAWNLGKDPKLVLDTAMAAKMGGASV